MFNNYITPKILKFIYIIGNVFIIISVFLIWRSLSGFINFALLIFYAVISLLIWRITIEIISAIFETREKVSYISFYLENSEKENN